MSKYLILLSFSLFLFACGELYSEQDLNQFDAEIQKLIAEKNWDCERSESGLYYQIIEEGDGDFIPIDAKVLVTYKGTLTNGKIFDQTSDEPVSLYAKSLIDGWREALLFLNIGSEVRLIIPPNLGYKNRELPDIPKNSILIFEIKIHGIE
jgi:FKBP-type peptidyl-prolyl cis-trans isomerase FkpA